MNEPKIIKGGLAVDDRGTVCFINDFLLDDVKRFYTITNHQSNFIRSWHAHKKERKYFTITEGSGMVCAVKIEGNDDEMIKWNNPSKSSKIYRFVLSAKSPSVLYIPEGYANGFMNLTINTKFFIFSSSTLEQSLTDDYRFPWDYFGRDFWEIKKR